MLAPLAEFKQPRGKRSRYELRRSERRGKAVGEDRERKKKEQERQRNRQITERERGKQQRREKRVKIRKYKDEEKGSQKEVGISGNGGEKG